jgi:hypothetical protein
MGESHRLQSIAKTGGLRRLTTSEERRVRHPDEGANAQHISACAFIQRSPERRVSPRIVACVRESGSGGNQLSTVLGHPMEQVQTGQIYPQHES